MDRAKAKLVREFLNELFEKATKKAERELKVKFDVGSISFSGDNASVKVQASDIGKGGQVMTKEATDFKAYASSFGLEADDLNKTFKAQGKEFKIIGLKPRSKKAPILAEANGRTYKVPAEMVKMYLGKNKVGV